MIILNQRKDNPFVSIITVTKNSEKYLRETLESFRNQEYKNFEVIVIDGNSTDNTKKIILENADVINFCISENDQGIYDAFNKGIKYSKGQYIGFVNSDDILLPKALKILSYYDKKYPDIDFLFGSVKKHWGIVFGYKPKKIKYSWGFYSSHSTGFFIKKKSAVQVGEYNIKYKYHADYDYFYRLIIRHKLKGVGTKKNEVFGIFRRGGYSSKSSFRSRMKEEMQIRIDHGQSYFLILIIFLNKLIRNFKNIIQDK